MGGFWSLFSRRDQSFEKVLENLEKNISQLEDRKKTRYLFQRKLVTGLLLYSLAIEVVIGIWFYFQKKPTNNIEKFYVASPLILFPLLVYIIKLIISSYYNYRIKSDDTRLTKLRAQLKQKLDERKKATDFDATQKLLSKYEKIAQKNNSPANSPKRPANVPPPIAPATPISAIPTTPAVASTPPPNTLRQRPQPQPQTPQQQVPQHPQSQLRQSATPTKPGWFDKLVDYMVGVNSQNGFALLCSNCKAHNGLAPASELENMQFRCRFCGHFNGTVITHAQGTSPQTPQRAPQQQQQQQQNQQQQPQQQQQTVATSQK